MIRHQHPFHFCILVDGTDVEAVSYTDVTIPSLGVVRHCIRHFLWSCPSWAIWFLRMRIA